VNGNAGHEKSEKTDASDGGEIEGSPRLRFHQRDILRQQGVWVMLTPPFKQRGPEGPILPER
jgi:hypothetical protein